MTFVFTLLSLFSALVYALPLNERNVEARDVFVPPVTYPHQGTIWLAGAHYDVTWETKDAPVNITNSIGQIYLRVGEETWLNTTLASGFNIRDGTVRVQAPKVPTGIDYSLVLFGDSGNFSPEFTIINGWF